MKYVDVVLRIRNDAVRVTYTNVVRQQFLPEIFTASEVHMHGRIELRNLRIVIYNITLVTALRENFIY